MMNFRLQLLTFLCFVFFTSCGPIMFNRTFLDEMREGEQEPMFRPGQSFNTVSGDDGRYKPSKNELAKRTPEYESINPEWKEQRRIKKELAKKLSSLSEEQQIWFERNQDMFKSDSQKIFFLSLSQAERDQYLYSLNANKRRLKASRKPASYFKYSPRESRVIAKGMRKDDVVSKWGNPHRVDVAGDPSLENERWVFYEAGDKRYVYFERGRVEGWVTD